MITADDLEPQVAPETVAGIKTGPIIPHAPDANPVVFAATSPTVPQDSATMGDLVSANFRRESMIGSTGEYIAYKAARMVQDRDPSYHPLADPEVKILPPHLQEYFMDSGSPAETEVIKSRLALEQEWVDTISKEGLTGRSFVASLVSQAPDMLLMWGIGAAARARFAAAAAEAAPRITGMKAIARGAAEGLAFGVASEAVKQGTQEQRTMEETANQISGATILGALIPLSLTAGRQIGLAGGAALEKMGVDLDAVVARATGSLDQLADAKAGLIDPTNRVITEDSTAGGVMQMMPVVKDMSPTWRVDKWSSEPMQKNMRQIFSSQRITLKNLVGKATTSLEDEKNFIMSHYDDFLQSFEKEYKAHSKGIAGEAAASLKPLTDRMGVDALTTTKLTKKEFAYAVDMAVRTGEKSPIEGVNVLADKARKAYETIAKESNGAHLPELEYDPKYSTRIYDATGIRLNSTGWDNDIAAKLVARKGMSLEEATVQAQEWRQSIVEGGGVNVFNARTIDLPDEDLAPYMIHDIREILGHYTQRMSWKIATARAAPYTARLAKISSDIAEIQNKLGVGQITAEDARHLAYGKHLEMMQAAEEYSNQPSLYTDPENGREFIDGFHQQLKDALDMKKRVAIDDAAMRSKYYTEGQKISEAQIRTEQGQRLEARRAEVKQTAADVEATIKEIELQRKNTSRYAQSMGAQATYLSDELERTVAQVKSMAAAEAEAVGVRFDKEAMDVIRPDIEKIQGKYSSMLADIHSDKDLSELAYESLGTLKSQLPKMSEFAAKVSEINDQIAAVQAAKKMVGPNGAIRDTDLLVKYFGDRAYTDSSLAGIEAELKDRITGLVDEFKTTKGKILDLNYQRTSALRLERLKYARDIELRNNAMKASRLQWMKDEVAADYKEKYNRLFEESRSTVDPALRAKLEAQANEMADQGKRAAQELRASVEVMNGNYLSEQHPGFARFTRGMLMYNNQRLLGHVLLMQLNDMGAINLKVGPKLFYKTAKAFARGILDDPEIAKETGFLRAVAGANEVATNGRFLEMSDVGGLYHERNAVEAMLERTQGVGAKLTLFAQWTDELKEKTAFAYAHWFLDAAERVSKGQELAPHEGAFLASLGMGQTELNDLSTKAFHLHESSGLRVPNFSTWGDMGEGVNRKFAMSIRKAVEGTIVTPTQGQKPLVSKASWFKIISQYKSYAMAAMESHALFIDQKLFHGNNLERAGLALGVTGMLVAGGASTALRRLAYGRDLPDSAEEWAAEALDGSGIGGLFMELNNTVEKITRMGGHPLGLRPALGVRAGAFRYSSRSELSSVLGPTFGLGEDILAATGHYDKFLNAATGHAGAPMPGQVQDAMWKMVPLNNAIVSNLAYDGIDGLGETITGTGFLPGKPLRRFGKSGPSTAP